MLSRDGRNWGAGHFTEMNFLSRIFLISIYSVMFSLITPPVRAMSSGRQLKVMSWRMGQFTGMDFLLSIFMIPLYSVIFSLVTSTVTAMSSSKQFRAMPSCKSGTSTVRAMSSGKQLNAISSCKSGTSSTVRAMSPGKQLKAMSSYKSDGKRELTNDERSLLYQFLLDRSHDGKLEHGSINAAAEQFSVTRRTVSRIWHQGRLSIQMGASIPDVSSKKAGNVGRKKINLDLSRVKGIPLEQRTNIRSLATALNVAKSTLHSRLKDGQLKVNSGIQHQLAAIYDT